MTVKNYKKAKNALYSSLFHICDIYGFKKVKSGGGTRNERVLTNKGIKCQLSQKSMRPSISEGTVSIYQTEAVLIICDDITIAPGSEIDIYMTNNPDDKPKRYKCASDPFIYPTHQEITLIRTGRA